MHFDSSISYYTRILDTNTNTISFKLNLQQIHKKRPQSLIKKLLVGCLDFKGLSCRRNMNLRRSRFAAESNCISK